MDGTTDGPRRAGRSRTPLTTAERRTVAYAAVAPVAFVALVLTPFATFGPLGPGDVVWSAVVYGGLLALASGFVAVDRLQARRCPRCGHVGRRGAEVCDDCGYDLVVAPRWACEERHALYLDPGVCECGRRLQPMPPARGVAAEVRWTLRFGAWLLAFLVLVGLVLSWTAR